ncbi:ABC transporter substrate-binding protein [Natronosporangium hydrolyticum]|uniref:ABC transporter substrate-binding protein n=1 Tax=Natronosporangium hydrolyticum TaxID=2811111 RepID=A0A895YGF5_9ACTN|nr:ABC transporter substrate-binding protein [Natronosporangium hydrolyticum]QSB13616.1 ABC transporter substrate-binding protein [Natronosporangium hydrolyticum]
MMSPARKRMRYAAPLLVVALTATVGCAEPETTSNEPAAPEFPRAETLYTGGSQWGPPTSWNPLSGGDDATGVRGLLYEPLYLFDPWTAELEPWLAEQSDWVEDDVYELTLRQGIEWSDGTPMTADDVVFTVELGRIDGMPYADVFDWLDEVVALDDHTVRFTFSDPRRGEWDNFLTSHHIVPEHLWSRLSEEDVPTHTNHDNPVGSGAYLYHSHTEDRMVWERNDDWWGTEALDLEMRPRYVIDVVNASNEIAFRQIVQNQLDLSNFFLPGIEQTVAEQEAVATFYPEEPYMLSANTAYLVPNTTRAPLDDPEFRRALAFSIDVSAIVEQVYGGIVRAADPTGLLPTWDDYVDDAVVAEFGFEYDPSEAEEILAAAGYSDTTGDGYVETPDGSQIELSLIVPDGWSDWNEAAFVIADGAREAGISLAVDFPANSTLNDRRNAGEFDLIIDNRTPLTNTPWSTYRFLFNMPIRDSQPEFNAGRYENPEAWQLTQGLARMSVGDPGFQETMSALQEITLRELPAIPMWYNGAWSQVNHSTWTNWPSDDDDTPNHYPVTWGGYWDMGAIYMLAELEPVTGG